MIGEIVPVFGVLVGLIVPLACFFWAYHEDKGKREAVVEIVKHLDDPAKIEELLTIFDERKSAPIDYRRGGVITLFVGVGIYLFGQASIRRFFCRDRPTGGRHRRWSHHRRLLLSQYQRRAHQRRGRIRETIGECIHESSYIETLV